MTPGTYQISRPNAGGLGEDLNQTGDFDILASGGDLTIANQSGGPVTVSGGGLDRVFDINPNVNFNANNPTPKFTVTLQDLTVTGGVAFSPTFTDGNGDAGLGEQHHGCQRRRHSRQLQRQPDAAERRRLGQYRPGGGGRHLDGESARVQHALDAAASRTARSATIARAMRAAASTRRGRAASSSPRASSAATSA